MAIQGVEHAKKLLDQTGELIVDGIYLVKNGVGFGSISKVFEIVGDIKGIIESAPFALPELADLDGKEAAELGSAAYSLVKKIIGAVKG